MEPQTLGIVRKLLNGKNLVIPVEYKHILSFDLTDELCFEILEDKSLRIFQISYNTNKIHGKISYLCQNKIHLNQYVRDEMKVKVGDLLEIQGYRSNEEYPFGHIIIKKFKL